MTPTGRQWFDKRQCLEISAGVDSVRFEAKNYEPDTTIAITRVQHGVKDDALVEDEAN